MKKDGIKHLIQCHCILPQFKKLNPLIFHQFIVFSEIDSDGITLQKYSSCNNCGVIHRVYDICKSEVLAGRDDNVSFLEIEDIEIMIPERLSKILRKNECDLATWENALFVIDNDVKNSDIVISRVSLGSNTQLKILTINSDNYRLRNEILERDIEVEKH